MEISKKIAKIAAIFSGLMLISKLLGIFYTVYLVFNAEVPSEAASIGIIGGADGPTAMFLLWHLLPHLLQRLWAPILSVLLEIAAYLFVFIASVKAIRNKK